MKHILLYATANDKRRYIEDIRNLYNLSRYDTGVGKVQMYMAISEVNKPDARDYFFIDKIKGKFRNHPFIEIKEVFFKSNIGRDFSSYCEMLKKVLARSTSPEDYTFIRNRSARGPFVNNWFIRYINQYERFEKIAICGNTINMYDHDYRSFNVIPHVQSYAFLSKAGVMNNIIDVFPGVKETTRLGVITKGEILLSQLLMSKGYQITSLNDKEGLIGIELMDEIKEKKNISEEQKLANGLPFYHYQDLTFIQKIQYHLQLLPFVWWA